MQLTSQHDQCDVTEKLCMPNLRKINVSSYNIITDNGSHLLNISCNVHNVHGSYSCFTLELIFFVAKTPHTGYPYRLSNYKKNIV